MTDLRLYVILDPAFTGGRRLGEVGRDAIAGGATILQVRAKAASGRELLQLTREVVSVARPSGVPVVVNDRTDIALAAVADGVHLGEDDLPVDLARGLLGADAIVGFSAGSADVARIGQTAGADYFGTGDVFGTTTKDDADPPIGLEGLRRVVDAATIPVVAIGGVTLGNAAQAVRYGAAGVAVISAVAGATDVRAAARELRAAVDLALGEPPLVAEP